VLLQQLRILNLLLQQRYFQQARAQSDSYRADLYALEKTVFFPFTNISSCAQANIVTAIAG
jgi:hypothetical protein